MPPLAAAIPAIIGGIGAAAPEMIGTAVAKEGLRQGTNLLEGDPEKKSRDTADAQRKAQMGQRLGQLLSGSNQSNSNMQRNQINMPQVLGMPQPGQM